jgi:signal transduction histidine kinase
MELDADDDIPEDLGSSAFRILQESLTNVARHANATRVTIKLTRSPTHLTLEVSDNGVGCAAGCLDGTRSLGLVGMRERALACGGHFKISGTPGSGTTVLLRVPLASGATQ